jgi:hypothetical protein
MKGHSMTDERGGVLRADRRMAMGYAALEDSDVMEARRIANASRVYATTLDMDLIGVHIDRDQSPVSTRRPELDAMIRLARRRDAETVLILRVDHVSCDRETRTAVMNRMYDHDLRVVTAHSPI